VEGTLSTGIFSQHEGCAFGLSHDTHQPFFLFILGISVYVQKNSDTRFTCGEKREVLQKNILAIAIIIQEPLFNLATMPRAGHYGSSFIAFLLS
jgi:hypothetical protein